MPFSATTTRLKPRPLIMGFELPEPIDMALTPGRPDRLCMSEPPKLSSM